MYKLKYKVNDCIYTIDIPCNFKDSIGQTVWKYSEIYEIIITGKHFYGNRLFELISHDIPKNKMKKLKKIAFY